MSGTYGAGVCLLDSADQSISLKNGCSIMPFMPALRLPSRNDGLGHSNPLTTATVPSLPFKPKRKYFSEAIICLNILLVYSAWKGVCE